MAFVIVIKIKFNVYKKIKKSYIKIKVKKSFF